MRRRRRPPGLLPPLLAGILIGIAIVLALQADRRTPQPHRAAYSINVRGMK